MKLSWRLWKASGAGLVGLAVAGGSDLMAAPPGWNTSTGARPETAVSASAAYTAVIDSMIEDAIQDGSVSDEERTLILSQARRRLDATALAVVEARLANAPKPLATISKGVVGLNDSHAADAAAGQACCDEPGCAGLFDNMYYFSAVDAWRGPIDDDDGNNFGARIGFNMGLPALQARQIGAQLGMSYNVYDFHGRDSGTERSSIEDQLFITTGLFKRSNLCGPCPDPVSWGLVYDHMITDNLGEDGWEIGLGQLRGQLGYALDATNEVGIMANLSVDRDRVDGTSNNQDSVRALDQASLFFHHKWEQGADTRVYVGIAEDPGEFVFGTRGEVPLNSCVSLFGSAHYVLPSTSGGNVGLNEKYAEEFWNVSVGFAYYPGGNAASRTVSGQQWMPLLPVADNGSFNLEILPRKL